MKEWKCKCGCGGTVRAFRHNYIHGHSAVGRKHDEDTKQKMRKRKVKGFVERKNQVVSITPP